MSTFFLIALGGTVRLMHAGLACPDWPLCFGDFIPDYHPQVYLEFIHRALAGVIGLVTVTLAYLLVYRSTAPRALKVMTIATVLLLCIQVVFGGLTVLMQLHSKVVAAHLGMGTGFFALLLWIYLSVKGSASAGPQVVPGWVKGLALGLLAAVYGQIILGGLVASHYASLVCTDFPTCHGQWFPTFRGIIGLQVIHRLGAYFVFLVVFVGWLVLKRTDLPEARKLAGWMFVAVCAQVGVGIANVLLHTPPIIAVAHLALGTLILSLTVRLAHRAFASRVVY